MLDIHTHILPEIDDGSSSVNESIEMLKMLKKQGVTDVVLTSHFYAEQETPETFFYRRKEAYEKLLEGITEEDDIPKLRLGAEVCYYIGLSRTENIERFCIEGTPLLLVEPPMFCKWDKGIINEMIDLASSGRVIVVVAHINRYFFDNNIKVFQLLASAGALFQINAESAMEKKSLRMLKKFDKRDLFHFIGTDCHNMTRRKPNYDEAMVNISKHIGDHTIDRLRYYEETFIY